MFLAPPSRIHLQTPFPTRPLKTDFAFLFACNEEISLYLSSSTSPMKELEKNTKQLKIKKSAAFVFGFLSLSVYSGVFLLVLRVGMDTQNGLDTDQFCVLVSIS